MARNKQTKQIDQTDRMSGNQTVLATLARTAFGAGATNTVWTPASGTKINLRYLSVTASGATVITVKLNALLVIEFDLGGTSWPIGEFAPPDDMIVEAGAADDLLTITSSAAVTVGATALGFEA